VYGPPAADRRWKERRGRFFAHLFLTFTLAALSFIAWALFNAIEAPK
jgi:hypothetical protein